MSFLLALITENFKRHPDFWFSPKRSGKMAKNFEEEDVDLVSGESSDEEEPDEGGTEKKDDEWDTDF